MSPLNLMTHLLEDEYCRTFLVKKEGSRKSQPNTCVALGNVELRSSNVSPSNSNSHAIHCPY